MTLYLPPLVPGWLWFVVLMVSFPPLVRPMRSMRSSMGWGLGSCWLAWLHLPCVPISFALGFQHLWAEATGGGMPLSAVYALQCTSLVVLALGRLVSSRAVPAGLGLGPAGPGLVSKLLAVEALQGSAHKGPQSEAPVSSGESDGVLFPRQYYLYQVCWFRLFFLCIPLGHPGGFDDLLVLEE